MGAMLVFFVSYCSGDEEHLIKKRSRVTHKVGSFEEEKGMRLTSESHSLVFGRVLRMKQMGKVG